MSNQHAVTEIFLPFLICSGSWAEGTMDESKFGQGPESPWTGLLQASSFCCYVRSLHLGKSTTLQVKKKDIYFRFILGHNTDPHLWNGQGSIGIDYTEVGKPSLPARTHTSEAETVEAPSNLFSKEKTNTVLWAGI